MKGYTIQHSIDLLEKQVEAGGSGGSTTAESVSYDNTSSGLTADDVQEAIDELKGAIPGIAQYGWNFSTTESKIGTFKGNDLYAKVVEFGALPATTTKSVEHGISDLSRVIGYFATAYDANNAVSLPYTSVGALSSQIIIQFSLTNVTIQTGSDRSGLATDVIMFYTKTAPVSNTRSKKSKKEE